MTIMPLPSTASTYLMITIYDTNAIRNNKNSDYYDTIIITNTFIQMIYPNGKSSPWVNFIFVNSKVREE